MKKKRLGLIITICALAFVLLLVVALLLAALSVVNHPEKSMFGYRLMLAERDSTDHQAGDLLLIRSCEPSELKHDDRVACLMPDGTVGIYGFIDCTDGGDGALVYDPESTGTEMISISLSAILGRYEKSLPVAGDLIGVLVGGRRDGGRTGGEMLTLATVPLTEPATEPETAAPSEPETEPETEPATEPAEITAETLAHLWINARVTGGPEEEDMGNGMGDEELLTMYSLDLRPDGTLEENSYYYVRIDPDAWQLGDPYMLIEGTYWGIPSIGSPWRTGTWSYENGKLTLNFDYAEFNDTPAISLTYDITLTDGWLRFNQTDFIVYPGSTQALCDAFGIAYQ